MAITKLLRLKESKKGNPAQHLINNIRYICDPEKTEGGLWIGGNAGQDTATIISTMIRNKKIWNKPDGSQGFHYVISFSPDCRISEQTASDFADDFVQELLGGKFYYVTAVHNDRHHMHVHITFDSVSMTDGMKYHSPKKDWERRIQPITDRLCRKYHLPVLEYEEEKKGVDYGEWRHRNQNEQQTSWTWFDVIRDDLEEALSQARSLEELIRLLQEEGYEVRNGKYLSVRPPGRERAVRTGRLGEGYSKEDLIRRIRDGQVMRREEIGAITYGNREELLNLLKDKKYLRRNWKMTPIQRQFYRRWYHTYFLRKPGWSNKARYWEDIVEINRIADALSYLIRNDIADVDGLQSRERDLKKASESLADSIRRIRSSGGRATDPDPAVQAQKIEELKEKRRANRKELAQVENIRLLFNQEAERNRRGQKSGRTIPPHTRITIHRKLFVRTDLEAGYVTRIPGEGGRFVLLPQEDTYMYESGEILSAFLYDGRKYSLCDREGNSVGEISGMELKRHYEDKSKTIEKTGRKRT